MSDLISGIKVKSIPSLKCWLSEEAGAVKEESIFF